LYDQFAMACDLELEREEQETLPTVDGLAWPAGAGMVRMCVPMDMAWINDERTTSDANSS
jgi:hypothetical protein